MSCDLPTQEPSSTGLWTPTWDLQTGSTPQLQATRIAGDTTTTQVLSVKSKVLDGEALTWVSTEDHQHNVMAQRAKNLAAFEKLVHLQKPSPASSISTGVLVGDSKDENKQSPVEVLSNPDAEPRKVKPQIKVETVFSDEDEDLEDEGFGDDLDKLFDVPSPAVVAAEKDWKQETARGTVKKETTTEEMDFQKEIGLLKATLSKAEAMKSASHERLMKEEAANESRQQKVKELTALLRMVKEDKELSSSVQMRLREAKATAKAQEEEIAHLSRMLRSFEDENGGSKVDTDEPSPRSVTFMDNVEVYAEESTARRRGVTAGMEGSKGHGKSAVARGTGHLRDTLAELPARPSDRHRSANRKSFAVLSEAGGSRKVTKEDVAMALRTLQESDTEGMSEESVVSRLTSLINENKVFRSSALVDTRGDPYDGDGEFGSGGVSTTAPVGSTSECMQFPFLPDHSTGKNIHEVPFEDVRGVMAKLCPTNFPNAADRKGVVKSLGESMIDVTSLPGTYSSSEYEDSRDALCEVVSQLARATKGGREYISFGTTTGWSKEARVALRTVTSLEKLNQMLRKVKRQRVPWLDQFRQRIHRAIQEPMEGWYVPEHLTAYSAEGSLFSLVATGIEHYLNLLKAIEKRANDFGWDVAKPQLEYWVETFELNRTSNTRLEVILKDIHALRNGNRAGFLTVKLTDSANNVLYGKLLKSMESSSGSHAEETSGSKGGSGSKTHNRCSHCGTTKHPGGKSRCPLKGVDKDDMEGILKKVGKRRGNSWMQKAKAEAKAYAEDPEDGDNDA